MKTPDLNKPGFKIFTEEAETISYSKCPLCKEDINESLFKDSLSRKEFGISGMCQKCQDKIFG